MASTIEDFKISNLSLKIQLQANFKAICYDSNYTVYFSTSDMQIYMVNVNQDFSSKTQRDIKNFQRLQQPLTKTNYCQVQSRPIAENSNEQVVEMSVYKSSSRVNYLLIISTHAMYSLELPRNSEPFDNLARDFKYPELHEIDLQSSCRGPGINFEDNQILDVKIEGTSVFIRLSKNKLDSGRGDAPAFQIWAFLVDDRFGNATEAFHLKKKSPGPKSLKIFRRAYLSLYCQDIEEFWIDPSDLEQVYFCLEKTLYCSRFISENGSKNPKSNECRSLYSSHYGIRFFQFSADEKTAICSDKRDRVIVLETNTWSKTRSFRISFGIIRQMKFCREQGLVYV